jgi:hypothetical protein
MPWLRSKRPRSLAGLVATGAEVLVVTLGSVVAISTNAWRQKSVALLGRLLRTRPFSPPATFELHELEGLPEPVARYFLAVLHEGQRIVRSAEISQRGHILVRAQPPGWKKFYATQHVATSPAGFLWDASVRLAPGISVLVRDSLIDGIGSMRASVMGLWPLVSVEGTPEIAAGALQRYLAEALWVPTALLPSQGVTWTPLDEASARATITSGATTVSVDFFFAADGTARRIYTNARSREVNGEAVPTPWQGRFSRYTEMHGMKIPMSAEVEWLLEEGPQEYWRGDVTSVTYAYEET